MRNGLSEPARIPPMTVDGATLAELLERVRSGSREASSRLFEQLYGELREIAGRVAGGNRHGSLSPTVVVHETWLKFQQPELGVRAEDRAHFLNLAARAMRQVVANHVRDRNAQKRGGGRQRERLTLVVDDLGRRAEDIDLVDLHEALASLEAVDQRQGDIAAMRIFGGLSSAEVSEVLGVSKRTIEIDWKMAKAHLARALGMTASDRS